jgi:hypothetical protein
MLTSITALILANDWTFSINQFSFTPIWIILCCLKIHRLIYINLSIHRATFIQKEQKPISKSAMMILNCFWATLYRYPLASKRILTTENPLNAKTPH